MNWKRYFLTVVAIFLAANITGFLIHGLLLEPDYTSLAQLYRTSDDAQRHLYFIWIAYLGFALGSIWMYAKGVDIYLAPTWDNSDVWTATLRHIAKEGRVYVLGVAPLLRGSDVPEDLRGAVYGGADDWMSRGHSVIVAPGGDLLAGPVSEREEILYAEVDAAVARASHREFDPVGHYSRPDIFEVKLRS